jgi:hypothetical protein
MAVMDSNVTEAMISFNSFAMKLIPRFKWLRRIRARIRRLRWIRARIRRLRIRARVRRIWMGQINPECNWFVMIRSNKVCNNLFPINRVTHSNENSQFELIILLFIVSTRVRSFDALEPNKHREKPYANESLQSRFNISLSVNAAKSGRQSLPLTF